MPSDSRETLLTKVMDAVARDGLADRSLREIAASVGTSHRMLIYHFGSREGLLAAIVEAMEARQRAALAGDDPHEVMASVWERVSSPEVRPFVRLFFEVFALSLRGDAPSAGGDSPSTGGDAPATLGNSLTEPWLEEAAVVAERLGVAPDRAALRLGVAVTRGLLLDLLAGAPKEEVDEAYAYFMRLYESRG
ncbi:TetR/AcrR family transcriptional regulator [Paractinoplanes rhizophilus]|jgi:AcrR family transcriptional regulator|uniref:TetR/AcrR family transcriptional regulator n=1 Tax=Paractinoplanes rhizophilus TaxID=1416877 RepID=A0ABW2HZ20_9ACTN|nr:TetR/AcrR family transcriptional regulator [Actinoplanes sp.]